MDIVTISSLHRQPHDAIPAISLVSTLKNICITSSITKTDTFIITAFYRTRWGKSSEAKSRNPEYTANVVYSVLHFEVHSSKCRFGQSETSKIEGNSWSLINKWCPFGIKWYHIETFSDITLELKRKVSLRTVMSRDCTPGRVTYRRFTWFSARQCPPLIT